MGVREDAARWADLITRLDERIPQIARDYVEELSSRALYPRGVVPAEDLYDTAVQTLRMLVGQLDGRRSTPQENDLVHSLGARRARQGLPLDTLTEAVRLDLLVIWRWLRTSAGQDYATLLADRFEQMLSVLDTYVMEVQASFLREQAVLERDARRATERDLSRLFGNLEPSGAVIERVSASTGLDPSSPLSFAGFDDSHSDVAMSRIERMTSSGDAFAYTYDGVLCVFWRQDIDAVVAECLDGVDGVVLQVAGVPQLPRAAATARALLRLGRPLDGLTPLSVLWPALVESGIRTAAPSFLRGILAGLAQSTEYERSRIIETVRQYLRSGSIKVTAERVFCHRNTVVNRLAAFARLTGLDVTVPAESALALIALESSEA